MQPPNPYISTKSYIFFVSIRIYTLIYSLATEKEATRLNIRRLVVLVFLSMAATLPSCAQSFLDDYFARVARNQAEQPHWVTPVATVTPRLEQEFRYDIFWQGHADGTTTENYDGSKGLGLELIPANNVEVIVNLPPYIVWSAME